MIKVNIIAEKNDLNIEKVGGDKKSSCIRNCLILVSKNCMFTSRRVRKCSQPQLRNILNIFGRVIKIF